MKAIRFVALVMKVALAAIAFAPRLVWEAGKWVIKEVSGAAGANSAAAAQAQVAAELQAAADEVAHAQAAPVAAEYTSPIGTPNWAWGTAALHVLAEGREVGVGILDEAALSYLEKLSPEQGLRLAAFSPDRIGRHLTGNEPIRSLPQPGSLHSYWAAEIQRLGAQTADIEAVVKVNPRASLDDRAPVPAYAR